MCGIAGIVRVDGRPVLEREIRAMCGAMTHRGPDEEGIYLGDGQFVHAVDERHGVMVSNLWDSYWAPRFVGASRAMG